MTTRRSLDEDAKFTLGEISGKIDLVLVQMAAQQQATEARFSRVEERLDAVEEGQEAYRRDRSWFLGGAAAVTAGVSGIATWLGLK